MLEPAPVDVVDKTTPAVIALLRERCDTCQQTAYLAATVNGTNLTYCVHHGTAYLPKLREVASFILDCRHLLSCD